MYIAEIICPGTWLDMDDQDIAFEVEGMLGHLKHRVPEAATALTMFESSTGDLLGNPRSEWERDDEIRAEVEEQLRAEVGNDLYYRNYK